MLQMIANNIQTNHVLSLLLQGGRSVMDARASCGGAREAFGGGGGGDCHGDP